MATGEEIGPDLQPGTGRSQQVALRHRQADHADGLGGQGGAQPRDRGLPGTRGPDRKSVV